MKVVLNPTKDTWKSLCTRPGASEVVLEGAVQAILEEVQSSGDAALRKFTAEFDGVTMASIAVSTSHAQVDSEFEQAILVAARNIRAFHAAQAESPVEIETTPGVTCWRKSVGIESVGVYIPGGTAPLFSTVLMLVIPAQIAGCRNIVLCTPPQKDGTIDPAILFTARYLGLEEIFCIGGAQAIAAMAYGTETIPKVDKIFGPGNKWVNAAKQRVLADGVATDLPAGPTEVALLIDSTSNTTFVAADILAQAEHDVVSDVLVVAVGEYDVEALKQEVNRQLVALPRREIASKVIETARICTLVTEEEALELLDSYAPEHLIIQTQHARALAERVRNAGSVFIGPWTPESLGDYASGTNHTLPTNGAARAYSGVSVDSFVRKITFQQATEQGLRTLGPPVATMARAEQLEGHARAVDVRLATSTAGAPPLRTAFVRRNTNETKIAIQLDLDGKGRSHCHTGLGFFDHMLDQIVRHSGVDLTLLCEGDLAVDEHHTIEDTAIALGEAFHQALGNKKGIGRYGFTAPMDDALANVALDFSGRSWLVWDVSFSRERIGDMPTEMFSHFFKSFCDGARVNLNISAQGDNEHHIIESIFKGFARALGQAIALSGKADVLPSTKGAL